MPEDYALSYFAVAFLDVLGQQEAWKGVKEFPTNEEERNKLGQKLAETVGFIDMLRRSCGGFIAPYTPSPELANKLAEKDRQDFMRMGETPLKIQSFSDCLVMSNSLEESAQSAFPTTGIFTCLASVGSSMMMAMATKHVLRGGIDVAIGVRMPETQEIYGPALNSAYQLESIKADYPRVVIGDGLIEYLTAMAKRSGESNQDKIARGVSQKCLALFSTDPDGLVVLDYLGKNFLKLSESKDGGQPMAGLVPLAKQFIEQQRNEAKIKADSKRIGRYERLIEYFNSRAPLGLKISESA